MKQKFLSIGEIEERLATYFDGVKSAFHVSMTGLHANVDLSYLDFKSPREVRRDLYELLPNIRGINIDREYSTEFLSKMFESLPESNINVNVEMSNGTIHSTSLFSVIMSVLEDMSEV